MSDSCLRLGDFELGFGTGELGLDLCHLLRQGGDLRLQRGNPGIDFLQVDQLLQIGIHLDPKGTCWDSSTQKPGLWPAVTLAD